MLAPESRETAPPVVSAVAALATNGPRRVVRCIIACLSGMRLARRYLIGGRVQGIGFRFFTQTAAVHEGVYGWVRNVPDGRVEVEAEGEAEALERFEHHIRHGPPGARVERVDVTEADATHRNLGFDIR
jgi:acylphosphatase